MSENHPGELELLAYAEGELDPGDATAAHVAGCAECAERVRLLEHARTALRAAPLLELPAERRERLLGSLPEQERRARVPLRALAAVAALVVIAAALALAFHGHGGGGPASGSSSGGSGAASSAGGEKAAAPTDLTAGPTPGSVAQALRSRGFDARAHDGRVVVQGAHRDAVRKALTALSPGSVPVVVKP